MQQHQARQVHHDEDNGGCTREPFGVESLSRPSSWFDGLFLFYLQGLSNQSSASAVRYDPKHADTVSAKIA